MNTNQGALYFGAGIDRTQWNRDIEAMRRDISGLTRTAVRSSQEMDSAFKNLSVGIASYFSASALKSFVMEMINVRGEFQKTEIAFATMLGDAGKAQALMGQMVELASKTPFSLQDVSSGAKQLLAFQIPANEVVDTLTRLGNIAAGLSVPLERINLVYGQVKAKGKLMGDDLRQFTEAGIPMVAELAKKFNKSTSEITAMVSAGKIGFKDVKDVLFSMTNEGGMFFNLMEKQSKSLSGQISNLGDTWDQMLNKIGESQESVLSGGVQGLIYLIEHYQEVGKVLLTLIEIYGAYRAALIVTNLLQTGMTSPAIIQGFANLIKIIRGVTVAQETLNAASIANPYVLLATLIAALIAITYNYRTELGELIGIIEKQTTAQKAQEAVMNTYNESFGKGVSQTKASISELISIIKNESSSLEQRKQAYERLIAIDPSFRGTLDAQYRATRRLGEALDFVIGKIDAFAMAQAKAAASRKFLEESFEEQFKAGALKTKVEDLAKIRDELERKIAILAPKVVDQPIWSGNSKEVAEFRKANEQLSSVRAKIRDISKEWREQQNIANEKTSISNTIVRNNNKEIAQKEKQLLQLEREIKLGKYSGAVLEKKQRQAEKLSKELSGFKPISLDTEEEVQGKPLGWAGQIKARIKEIEDSLDGLSKVDYFKAEAELKRLNELLNPKKEKKDSQWAEIIPIGSIKELQRRAGLLQDAYDTAINGLVKIRKLDKYGKDKDEKGNPFFTGEVISVEEAKKRLEEINAEIKKRQIKSFEEQISETRRQIEVRDKLLKLGYSKDTVDAMFPEVKDKTFLQYLNETNDALKNINDKQSADNLVKLHDILNDYTGGTTFIENVNKQIDSLKLKFQGNDLIEKLQKFKSANAEGITGEDKNSKNIAIDKAIEEEQERQKNAYQEFLNEQKSFEEKKTEIENKYGEIRRINAENGKLSPEKKTELDNKANKEQAKEISTLSLELFQKTDLWVKAFGDLEKVGPRTLKKIRAGFASFLNSDQANKLNPEDLKAVQEAMDKLDDQIENRNPFAAIGIAIEKYTEQKKKLAEVEKKFGKNSAQYREELENTRIALGDIFEVSQAAANASMEFAGQLGAAFGLLSQEAQDTLKDVQQLFDGIVNAVAGYASGDYGKMAGGIIQIVTSLTKLMNGDVDREKHIRKWQRAIDDLKMSYDELLKVIEKTAGESALQMQRQLISNLREQQDLLVKMRDEENDKKNGDADKISSYNQQIQEINNKIQELADNFKTSVTTIEFKDLAEKMADALTQAFGQGEDAAKSFEKVVDDVMRSAVANALKIKFLEPAVKDMVDALYSSMGFGNNDTTAASVKLKEAEAKLAEINKTLNQGILGQNISDYYNLSQEKKKLEQLISDLKQQIAASNISGSFDGLTQEERDKIKAMGVTAMEQYTAALQQYQELFGESAENAQGLKGDIKGITEKTAGALEAQFNAFRITVVEILKLLQNNQLVSKNQTLLLSQIEFNTRNLIQMRKDLAELNAKTKNQLAGIP